MKKALIVGIDSYSNITPLAGCVNDAIAVANVIEKNGDGSPNFSIKQLTSNDCTVDAATLQTAIEELFTGDAETALFYFAGHGLINQETNSGYIVSQDAKKGAWGVSLSDVLTLANKAYPKIKSTIILLDSCHSGQIGEVPSLDNSQIAAIGTGVTILTACHRNATAVESDGHGLFTSILLDSLQGSSADICGRITPASVYAHIDQSLGPWEQRPNYKANVQTFITLREVAPKVSLEILRKLPTYFKEPNHHYPLDPSFEPDRKNVPKEIQKLPVNEEHTKIFKELQLCNRYGLVTPVDAEHMYYAAINSKACKLTALGAHYRKLATMNRI